MADLAEVGGRGRRSIERIGPRSQCQFLRRVAEAGERRVPAVADEFGEEVRGAEAKAREVADDKADADFDGRPHVDEKSRSCMAVLGLRGP